MLIIILRWIHVVLGATWVGFALFGPLFLMPAIQDTGPDGGKVAAALQRRGLMTFMPVLAIATLVSGFWLYWIVSGGFEPAYMGSGPGMAFGTGGVLALAGFLIGITIMRPAMLKSARLMQQGGDMAEVQSLRARGARANQVVAVLLVLAVSTMAVGRYL